MISIGNGLALYHLQVVLCIYGNNPLPGNEPYNAVDAISMRHDICYRDNETSAGKRGCDRKMLAELDALIPEGRREKVDSWYEVSLD